MQLYELKKAIKNKKIPQILILTGEEQGVITEYVHKISEVFGFVISRLDLVREVIQDLGAKSLSGNKKLYVIRDSKDFQNNEKLWEKLPSLLKENRLIFVYSNLDKRSKLFKKFSKTESSEISKSIELTEFPRLTEEQLAKCIMKKIPLKIDDAKYLAFICGYDYGRVLSETNKLKCLYYANKETMNYTTLFNIALDEDLFHKELEEKVFEFVDALLGNKVKKSINLLHDLKSTGTAPVLVVSLLYTNFRRLLLVQESNDDLKAEALGMTGWQLHNVKKHIGRYSKKELLLNLKILRKAEKQIKTGQLEPKYALDFMACELLKV